MLSYSWLIHVGLGGGTSSEIMGGDFADGFKLGIVVAAAGYLYNGVVAKDPTLVQNGKGVVGLNEVAKNNATMSGWIHDNILIDSSPFMTTLSKIPGFNSFGKFHDALFKDNGGFLDFEWYSNIPTMPPSIVINYASLYNQNFVAFQMIDMTQRK